MTFAQPSAPGDFDKIPFKEMGAALAGSLVLFQVHSVVSGIVTSNGVCDAAEVDAAFLSGPLQGQLFTATRVFPKMLVSALRGKGDVNIGQQVLGRLKQGTPKNPAHTPPWLFEEYTEMDVQIAMGFLNANPMFGKQAPQQPAPAAQGWSHQGAQQATGGAWGAPPPAAQWGQQQPAANGWGAPAAPPPPANPYDALGVGHRTAELQAAGVTPAHIEAVRHIDGYAGVPAPTLKAKAEELNPALRPQAAAPASAWDAPPF